jgi:hypothetical protein
MILHPEPEHNCEQQRHLCTNGLGDTGRRRHNIS